LRKEFSEREHLVAPGFADHYPKVCPVMKRAGLPRKGEKVGSKIFTGNSARKNLDYLLSILFKRSFLKKTK